jgi:hypothetical protein
VPRVLVITLSHKPNVRAVRYAHLLAGQGVDVDLVVADPPAVRAVADIAAVEPHERVRVHALLRRPIRKLPGPVFGVLTKVLRPWSLSARRHRRRLAPLDVGAMDRIVAGDITAVSLAWKLARAHPGVMATTALDTAAYAAGGPRTPDPVVPEPIATE